MDKRIAVFIFSCILLLRTVSGASTFEPSSASPEAVGTNSAKPSSPPVSDASMFEPSSASPEGANNGSVFDKPSSSPPTGKMSTSMVTSPDSSSPKPVTTVSSWIDTSTTTPKSDTTSTTKYTSLSNNTSTTNSASVQAFFEPSENPADHKDSKESSEKRYLWILLPALCILLAALIYLKFMCKKVQHRPEMTDNGTENASFQRTESNKDGVMLLGVNKTAIGEDNTR
ncbi:putative protein TPRXL isoform X2 [Myxocyprinus asiaticus]|uniref:putative protein TPRXL isoform X2 n=1 Tax=Myxocyprinus asiaticus TaxID=70543 RepID=UPI002221F577|nr:putative protein TPRXL isoform X2 [Myxocyprinus asiaticus]